MRNRYILIITTILIIAVLTTAAAFFMGIKPQNTNNILFQESLLSAPTTAPDYNQILNDITSDGINCTLTDAQGNVIPNSCSVDKVSGDYAKGIMPQGYWIAKKLNNIWRVSITGNGIPNCQEIDEKSIPQDIYGNCIEDSGKLRHE